MRMLIVIATLAACGCTDVANSPESAYTLYRNSNLDRTMRVHWATFDADESDPSYNANNCGMAARLLNANMAASAQAQGMEPYQNVGFWCEPGSYSETGAVPSIFESAYPTDV